MSRPVVSTDASRNIEFHQIHLGFAGRLKRLFLRLFLRPYIGRLMSGRHRRIARSQVLTASSPCKDSCGLAFAYRVVGRVPGHVVGNLEDSTQPVVLWLHGGAFVLPASPMMHGQMLARICRDLGASGFLPDYRLAPYNRFPAGLDDCERAYDELLERGFDASQIVVGGDSAGGNLTLGLLQRLRAAGKPLPACAIPVSPVTELGRIHGPPSRVACRRHDPILPVAALSRVDELYAGDWDASDPLLSPLYMDCKGMPPMRFVVSDREILLDDSLMLVDRAREAGVDVSCDVWSDLPHAPPVFEPLFAEAGESRKRLTAFAAAALVAAKP